MKQACAEANDLISLLHGADILFGGKMKSESGIRHHDLDLYVSMKKRGISDEDIYRVFKMGLNDTPLVSQDIEELIDLKLLDKLEEFDKATMKAFKKHIGAYVKVYETIWEFGEALKKDIYWHEPEEAEDIDSRDFGKELLESYKKGEIDDEIYYYLEGGVVFSTK